MYIPHVLSVAIGKLRLLSHQLEIENGRVNLVPAKERICRLCHIKIEYEYHFTYKCLAYIEIRENYHDMHEPFYTLSKLLDTSAIKTLGRYILELK